MCVALWQAAWRQVNCEQATVLHTVAVSSPWTAGRAVWKFILQTGATITNLYAYEHSSITTRQGSLYHIVHFKLHY